ncbi:MAG: hypothetical protein EP347_04150 [Alphaproteobacteria bacterium]|nr:MAG: hypothetical protein EP347_04150 [Alphaproteobacteria bacterium]
MSDYDLMYLAWHPVKDTPDFFLTAMPSIMGFAIFLAYAGSVYFFFSQRRLDTQTVTIKG